MAVNIPKVSGFERSTSGIYEKKNIEAAENTKSAGEHLQVEEGQVIEGVLCEKEGKKSIQVQGEEIPVGSQIAGDYEVGETLYLKVEHSEEGKVALKILSTEEAKQIKADAKKTLANEESFKVKGNGKVQDLSNRMEAATRELARLVKESKVTVTVSKDVETAVEKVSEELDARQIPWLEQKDVEVENTDVRTLSNMISNLEEKEQREAGKEEIMKAAVEQGKELSTFPDGKMYYIITNELELTVNNLYKAEYSYDKEYVSQSLSNEEWEQLKPKVEEYLIKEQIAPNKENMEAAKWLVDQKLPITKANVADVKAMQTMTEKGLEEGVLKENVAHYFELNLDPKEANVFYENESKVAEQLMEKVGKLEDKDLDSALKELVKEDKPLTLDHVLEAVESQGDAGSKLKDLNFKTGSENAKEETADGKENPLKDAVKEKDVEHDFKENLLGNAVKKKEEKHDFKEKLLEDAVKENEEKTDMKGNSSENVNKGEKKDESDSNGTIKENHSSMDASRKPDELDSNDVNYRKIENQEKREHGEKQEETPSVKEDVSYEQLGKVHRKRPVKRFGITEVAKKAEENEDEVSKTGAKTQTEKESGHQAGKVLSEANSGKNTEVEDSEVLSGVISDKKTEVEDPKVLSEENSDKETKMQDRKVFSEFKTEKEAEVEDSSVLSQLNSEKEIRDQAGKMDSEAKKETQNQDWKILSESDTSKETQNQDQKMSFESKSDKEVENQDEKAPLESHKEPELQSKKENQVSKEESEHLFHEIRKGENEKVLPDAKETAGEDEKIRQENSLDTVSSKNIDKDQKAEKEEIHSSAKGQNQERISYDERELEAKVITAKRQLEEIRLKLTLSSAKLLAKNDIKIDTKELSEIVDHLRELEKEAIKEQLVENRMEPTEENMERFVATTRMAEELKEMPSYAIGKFVREPIPMTMEGLHEEGRKQKADFDAANERYETMMTKPRRDMGDSIQKAFRNVDDILEEMDLEVNEANQRAVRILGYNSMEITTENIEAVKAKDLSVNRLLQKLTPQTVLELIRDGENVIKLPVEELNQKIELMNNEAQEKDIARYSEFLYKLEKNKEITPEERTAFVGIYRLLDKVVKSKGHDIGALVKSGQEITLKNLLTAQRTIKASKIDANIDDEFGMVSEVIEKGVKITDQIEQGFSGSKAVLNDAGDRAKGIRSTDSNRTGQGVIQGGIKASQGIMQGETKTLEQEENAVKQALIQEEAREQEYGLQQKISYQQDLAREILEHMEPADLQQLSKIYGENLELMTFEQIKERLTGRNAKNPDVIMNGDEVLEEYQKEQVKELKQLAQVEQRVIKALSDFEVSKTLSNVKAFETMFSKETPLFEQIKKEFEPKNKKEGTEKKIHKSISSLGGFFEEKEEAVRAYEEFSEDLMEESAGQETLSTKEILARKNLMLTGSLMAKMAREESFLVPVQIQKKDTTMEVTLKSEGAKKGSIYANILGGGFGEISAELFVQEETVSVYAKAESKEGETVLNKALDAFKGSLGSKHQNVEILNQPVSGNSDVSVKQLYQVAKSFVEAFRE